MNSWMCGSGEISARDLRVICAEIENKVMGGKGDDPKKMCRPKEKMAYDRAKLLNLFGPINPFSSVVKLKAPFSEL